VCSGKFVALENNSHMQQYGLELRLGIGLVRVKVTVKSKVKIRVKTRNLGQSPT